MSGTIHRSAFALRQAPSMVLRRSFSASSVRAGGYHYPEGPRSNLPFNPLTRFFALRYIAFCSMPLWTKRCTREYQLTTCSRWLWSALRHRCLPDQQERLNYMY
jgi:cytochrome c oxidase subunit 7c